MPKKKFSKFAYLSLIKSKITSPQEKQKESELFRMWKIREDVI